MSNKKEEKTMKPEEKRALEPKLRFPEFWDAGEWAQKTIDDFLTVSCIPGSKGDVAKKITVKLWGNGVFAKNETTKGSVNTQYFRRKAGQFIYSKLDFLNQAFGIIPTNLDNFESTVDLPCFDFSEGLNPVFLLEYVKRKDFYEKHGETADGSRKAKRIQIETFLSLPILLPDPDEQQKIADCLSSIDELVTLEAQKLDTLKAHKKGLMQQLFPAEGETLPKLRFPEFQDAGEWEEKTLGQVADYENGKAHEQDIDEQGKYIVVNSKFISTEGEVKKFSDVANLLAKKGDILMVLSDVPNGRAIAKCFFVDKDNAYTVNQRICKLTAKNAVSLILFYIFDRNSYFLAFDDGVKQTNLKKDDVLSCPVLLPRDKEEQQKIADCLTSLDELITAQGQKLDTLKAHKKGLMQQLFPALDEVQG